MTTVPPNLRYKHNHRDIQQQHDDDAAGDSKCLDAMAADQLFVAMPVLSASNPMFEHVSDEEMATAQFHDAFCVEMRPVLSDGLAIPFGDSEDGNLCRQVTHDESVIFNALK